MVDKKQDGQEVDEFEGAFNTASETDGKVPGDEGQDNGDEGKGGDEGSEDKAKQTDEGKAKSKPEGDEGKADEGKHESAEDRAKRLEEENAKLTQKTRSWEGRISATARENAELKARLQAIEEEKSKKTDEGKVAGKDGAESEEDDEEVKTFKSDYPNLAGSIEKLLAKERQKIRKEVSDDLGKQVDEKIKPVAEHVQQTKTTSHMAALLDAHPDWKQHTNAVYEWVDEQPDYLQGAMRQVLERGNASQVIDLLDKYKAANGISAKEEQNRQDDGKQQTGSKDKRQKQADDAEAVRSKPGDKPKGKTKVDEDDFDGAFNAAIGKS